MTYFETNIHPLSKLAAKKAQRVKTENVTLSANSTTTVATLTGSGMVSTIWMTMAAQDKDIRLQVFVDGEIVPSIDVDCATLFLSTFIADSANGIMWNTQNVHGEGGFVSSQGGFIKYPIPYSNGCVIKMKTVASLSFYCMVDYIPNLNVPYRLKSYNRSYTYNPVTFATTDSLDMFTTPSGSPGWFVFFGYEAAPQGGTGDKYLERNFLLYLDGEGTASHQSSGTEDFFFGSYYWQWKSGGYNNGMSNDVAALSYRNTSTSKSAVCVDLMELCNGIYFTSQCRLNIATEAAVDTGHNAGFVALFYTPVTSSWAQPVLSAIAPQPPTNLVATGGNASASISFVPPTNNGGASITTYTITSSPGGLTGTGASSPITVSGLANGTAYTFTATATNSAGTSTSSRASNSVTPAASGTPGAPTSVSATAGNASATVTFTAPASNGGSAITGYTATSTPGSFTGSITGATAAPITVSGLTNGTAYTFTVHATNANGNGTESAASNSVTPAASTTYLNDTFTGANSTNSLGTGSHTPDTNTASGTWASDFGTNWGITSNAAYVSSNLGTESHLAIDCGHTDGTLTCDMTLTSATNRTVRGLVFRYASSSNFMKLVLVKVAGTNQLELRTTAGLLATDTGVGLVDGTTYAVKIVLSGNSCQVYINGTLRITNTDSGNSGFTGTKVGFMIYDGSTTNDDDLGTWDNLKFTS